ncbi:MAG: DUF1566 domain-containing protein [Gammaproteobacteria bacterium]|nr:DUF1566 domain-containing protein [Gammaproteobacteria bacterium]
MRITKMKPGVIKLLILKVFICSVLIVAISYAEDSITGLDNLELQQLEAEVESLSNEKDIFGSLEKDKAQMAEDLMAVQNKEQEKEIKINPQKCFLKPMLDDPIHFAVCNAGNTILDKRTGLMWDRCSYGKTWNEKKQYCEGKAAQYSWQDSLLTISDINKYKYFDKSDWRLPNIKELSSLVDSRCMNPSIDMSSFPEKYIDEFEPGRYDYWTSSVFEQYPQRAWAVDFNLGQDYPNNKRLLKNIRLVRLGSNLSSYDIATDKEVSLDEQCVTYPAISFSHVVNVPTEAEINSDELIIVFSGIEKLPLSVTNGEYQLNNSGKWLTNDQLVRNNDKLKIRHISAKEFLTDNETLVKIGAQSATFKSTTLQKSAEAFNDYLSDEKYRAASLYDSLYDDFLKGLNDSLSDIVSHYDVDKYKLTQTAQENILEYFESNKDLRDQIRKISIIGHTDSTGSKQYNQKLSIRRAQGVYNFIHLMPGFETVKIEYIGRGLTQPIADNNNEQGRAQNRRVDVLVSYE